MSQDPVSQTSATLRLKLTALRQSAERASRQLADAAVALRRTGTPPHDELRAVLAALSSDWDDLQIDVFQLSGSTADLSLDAGQTLAGLADQLDSLQHLAQAEEILRTVAAIRQTDGNVSEELAAVHAQALSLLEPLQTPAGAELAQSLLDGTHPCAALLCLLRDGETLADSQWLALQDHVEQIYGPLVATACARGKLTLPSADDVNSAAAGGTRTAPPTAPTSPLTLAAITPSTPEPISEDPGSRPASHTEDSIFDDALPDERVMGPALILDRSTDLHEMSPDAGGGGRGGEEGGRVDRASVTKMYRQETEAVYASAQAARTATDKDRAHHLSELIVHLVRQDRLGLAYHLARCVEAHPSNDVPHLPSWLLHALALSSEVSFAKGRLASLLEEDFQECHERDSNGPETEWTEAAMFFVRAAVLRPAIVAPTTRAAAILRSFPQPPSCTELHNYCSRIGASSERLQGLMPSLFKRHPSDVTQQDRLDALQSAVRHWRDLLAEQSLQYVPAKQLFLHAHWTVRSGSVVRHAAETRLWQKWQQTLRLVDGVVDRILHSREEEQHQTRAEIARLGSVVRLGTAEEQATTPGGSGLVFLPAQEMYDAVREAMAFGQQWLSLLVVNTTETEGFLPQAAEELRAEILTRHDSVIDELAHYRDRSRSLIVQAGVECLMRSIQRLLAMVDPHADVRTAEPPPRHLLHAELLKMPALPIDENWEPQLDATLLARQIVRFLTEPQPDWTTAFLLYCESGLREGTDRLLELNVWTSAEERERLRRLRDEYVTPTRESLLTEIDEFEHELSSRISAESAGHIDERTIQRRLDELRDQLQEPATSNFNTLRAELNELWSGMASRGGDGAPSSERRNPASPGSRPGDPTHDMPSSVDIFDD